MKWPLSRSPNFPRAQYLDIRTLTHELIVNGVRLASKRLLMGRILVFR